MQNLKEKKEINCKTNIDHTVADIFGLIRNASNEYCSEEKQPTENTQNDVIILPDILNQLEFDENDCELGNPSQITGTVPSLKGK